MMLTHRESLAKRKAEWMAFEGLDDVEGGVKCPRCYRKTAEGHYNFDGLCDRCCRVILDCFPSHWSVDGIKQSFAAQKEKWKNESHDPLFTTSPPGT